MRNSVVGGLLCLSLFFSPLGFAQTAGNAPKPLSAMEQALIANSNAVAEAQKSKNVDFLKRTLTDDFLSVGSDGGLHDKQEMLENARGGELKDYYTYDLRVLSVNDTAAIVTFDCIVHMPEGEAPGVAPRYQHFSDLWVKQGDQWRLKFQQATVVRSVD
jgi:hypothetical protein